MDGLTRPSRARPGALVLLIAALTGVGCSKSPTGPRALGDAGGTHLVVYASDRNQAAGQFDLYLYDLDAGGFRLLSGINSPSAPDLNPTISSDGRFIAFESNRGGPGGTDILMYDRLRAEFVQLGDANSAGREGEPAFTGDGRRLAFVRDTLSARRIRLIDGVSFKFIRLAGLDTVASYSDWAPAPNRDGSRIAFVSDRNGTADVFIWESDSTSRVLDLPELRSPDGNEVEPTLTPDGRFLCLASNRSGGAGGYDLYLYDLQDVGHPVPVSLDSLNTAHDERNPSISADGMIISFESNRDGGLGKTDIWTHNRGDGRTGQAHQLSSAGDDIQPSLKWP